MNKFILSFFDAMSEAGISYCHFKSNNNLEPALNGVDDLDLLISENDVDHFNLMLATFGFRMATDRGDKPTLLCSIILQLIPKQACLFIFMFILN